MLPRLADRAPECSHTTPISPGLLRFLSFPGQTACGRHEP